jgi:hypothetical protein
VPYLGPHHGFPWIGQDTAFSAVLHATEQIYTQPGAVNAKI